MERPGNTFAVHTAWLIGPPTFEPMPVATSRLQSCRELMRARD